MMRNLWKRRIKKYAKRINRNSRNDELGIGKYSNYPCNNCSKVYLCGNGDSCRQLDSYYKEREK